MDDSSRTIPAAQAGQAQGEAVAWYLPADGEDDSMFRDHRTVISCTGNAWAGWIPLYTHPAPAVDRGLSEVVRDALQEAQSVCASIRTSDDRKITKDSCVMYAQTEAWCRWAEFEVLPKIKAALAASAPSQAEPNAAEADDGGWRAGMVSSDGYEPPREPSQWEISQGIQLVVDPSIPAGQAVFKQGGKELGRIVNIGDAPSQAGSCQASGEVEVDRLKRVTRFALRRFMHDAYARARAAGQDIDGRHFKPGDMEKFIKDAKDAEQALAELEAPPAGRTLTGVNKLRDAAQSVIEAYQYRFFDGARGRGPFDDEIIALIAALGAGV